MAVEIILALLSFAFVLAAFFTIGYLWWQLDQPPTETDRVCSRVDVDLDELRGESSIRHYVGGGWRT